MSSHHIVENIAPEQAKGCKRKRTCENERPKHTRKYPKRGQLHLQIDDKLRGYPSFRFLKLPSEIRNQIYEYAAEYTHRNFPMLYVTREDISDKRLLRSDSSTKSSVPDHKSIPYLSLTQVCLQIKAEFRPMWLSTHRIPFNLLESYLKAFFVVRVPKVVRSNIFGLDVSSLRIWVRSDDLGSYSHGCDVTRLFKHKARFPNCTISCQWILPPSEDYALRQLEKLINHNDVVWRKAIITNKISQVRLSFKSDKKTVLLHIVIKEKYAEPWMKVISKKPSQDTMKGFLRQFGFTTGVGWDATVCVSYS